MKTYTLNILRDCIVNKYYVQRSTHESIGYVLIREDYPQPVYCIYNPNYNPLLISYFSECSYTDRVSFLNHIKKYREGLLYL